MTDEQLETTGEMTERFRAFSEQVDPEPSRVFPMVLIALGALVVVGLAAMAVVIFG